MIGPFGYVPTPTPVGMAGSRCRWCLAEIHSQDGEIVHVADGLTACTDVDGFPAYAERGTI